MNQPARISYAIMAALLVLIAVLHLGTLLLTALFGFFALQVFSFGRSKILGVSIYVLMVALISWGMIYFSHQAYLTLPKIAETTIPAVATYAEQEGIELPFSDYAGLKNLIISEAKEDVAGFGRHARETAFKFVQLLIGLVVATSLFLSASWGSENEPGASRDSLYATVVRELSQRFQTFFRSFAKVIGAQIIVSAINTVLTAAFLLWNDYPYVAVITTLTFLCGLLPIVGNLLSNTLIVGIA
ncbi:MAG: hypothetical protein WCJ07_04585, partial [Verrucomicrobiota bacterium]